MSRHGSGGHMEKWKINPGENTLVKHSKWLQYDVLHLRSNNKLKRTSATVGLNTILRLVKKIRLQTNLLCSVFSLPLRNCLHESGIIISSLVHSYLFTDVPEPANSCSQSQTREHTPDLILAVTLKDVCFHADDFLFHLPLHLKWYQFWVLTICTVITCLRLFTLQFKCNSVYTL